MLFMCTFFNVISLSLFKSTGAKKSRKWLNFIRNQKLVSDFQLIDSTYITFKGVTLKFTKFSFRVQFVAIISSIRLYYYYCYISSSSVHGPDRIERFSQFKNNCGKLRGCYRRTLESYSSTTEKKTAQETWSSRRWSFGISLYH